MAAKRQKLSSEADCGLLEAAGKVTQASARGFPWRLAAPPPAATAPPIAHSRVCTAQGKNLIDLVGEQVVTEKTFQTFLERHVQSVRSQGADRPVSVRFCVGTSAAREENSRQS